MSRKLVLLTAIFALLCARMNAQNPTQPFDPVQAWSQLQQQLVQQFDANGDGKLAGQEQLMAQEFLRRQGMNIGMPPGGFPGADQFNKQFDRNRDGKLDPMEQAAAAAAFNRMRSGVKRGVGGGVQRGATPQPQYDPAAAGQPKEKKVPPLIKRFDKDGDGKLNDAEKAEAQAEFKKSKSKDDKDAKDEKSKDSKSGKG